jgi:polyhydroxyalkanoate synthase
LVRDAALRDAELGRSALKGLKRYQDSTRPLLKQERPIVATLGPATLRDCGGKGRVLVLVPSLINPPDILDLDADCSLAASLARSRRVLLLDWGPAEGRKSLDLRAHVETLLLPLLGEVGAEDLVGYCLGGTLALEAAGRSPSVHAVATLAAPYDFRAYPKSARQSLVDFWHANHDIAEQLGFLPMELLQAAFWRMDPQRIVAKFARFASLESGSAEAKRFVVLEDWANGGQPLPLPAARELVLDLFGAGSLGLGALPDCALLHVTAANDRIVPAATAAPGERLHCRSGHVGMIVGRDARAQLHDPLLSWLEGQARRR